MNTRPMILVSMAVVVVMLAASSVAWTQLPADALVPIHWGPNGQSDGWAGKAVGLFLLPAITVGVAGLLAVVPRFEPRRTNLERSGKAYGAVWIGVVLLLGVMHLVAIWAALGAQPDMTRIAMLGTGGLFIAMGNYLPKVRPNYMLGVRTPWTLASDLSWRRTHRLIGRVFVLEGLALVALALAGASGELLVVVLLGSVAAVLAVALVYSYQVWKTDPEKRPS